MNSTERLGRRMRRLQTATGVGLVAAFALAATSQAGAAEVGGLAWSKRAHVVGGPVAADGRVLVITTGKRHSAWLEAIDPATGAVRWRAPQAFSYTTAGVVAAPIASSGVTLAVVPSPKDGARWVRLKGIDVTSGKVRWRYPRSLLVVDAPGSCPAPLGAKAFCVVVADSSAPARMIALSPRSGKLLGTVSGVGRLLSRDAGLYESDDKERTLARIGMPGGARWSARLPDLFGPGYGTDFGWNFDSFGAIDVGHVGIKASGSTVDLGAYKTVGLEAATGKPLWTLPGIFQCGGATEIRHPYVCQLSGTVSAAGTISSNATISIKGFAPATGSVSWQMPLRSPRRILFGPLPIEDEHHAVLPHQDGRQLLVDLRAGTSTAPSADQRFWCASHSNSFRVRVRKGRAPEMRVGSPFHAPCDRDGRPVRRAAAPTPVAGVSVGGRFVWSGRDGLKAVR